MASSSFKKRANQTRYNSIPVLHTSGTHYEIGYDVGRTFRSMIQEFLEDFTWFKDHLLPAFKTPAGQDAYDRTLITAEYNFPQYVDEIRGTADGAQVQFHMLMLLHLDRIILPDATISSKASMGCSSVLVNYENEVLLGHTEDAFPETLNRLYIVSATIHEDEPQGRYKIQDECFTSLCYPGYLPGFCMGYNSYGIVYSINVLFPKVRPGKTAPYFLTRAMLAARNKAEVELILADSGVGAADGFSVNACFLRQENDIVLCNIEVAPPQDDSQRSLTSTLVLSKGSSSLHTNKYSRLDVPVDKSFTEESSDTRENRAKKCGLPVSKDSLIKLLSNTEDEKFQFFREQPNDEVLTVSMGVFNLLEETWTMWMKNPNISKQIGTLQLLLKYPQPKRS